MTLPISILNDVIGPIMIGPSSSHTAGTVRIGQMARYLLNDVPKKAEISFDPNGSLAYTYRGNKSDRGLVGGLLGWETGDERIPDSLSYAKKINFDVEFVIEPLPDMTHPSAVRIELEGENGKQTDVWAETIGGGAIHIVKIFNHNVFMTGANHELVMFGHFDARMIVKFLCEHSVEVLNLDEFKAQTSEFLNLKIAEPIADDILEKLNQLTGVEQAIYVPAILPISLHSGSPCLFQSGKDMLAWAETHNKTLGQTAIAYETELSGLTEIELQKIMQKNLQVMRKAVQRGLNEKMKLQLVEPVAAKLNSKRMITEGPSSRALVYALAVMEVNNAMGTICAAPTAGSAGIIPGALLAVAEKHDFTDEELIRGLFAAGGIGLVVANRATFAGDVAGCQAECGVASAMAAAMLVELFGGSASEAEQAASVALQNTIGLICDPVAGLVEVPCFGRNSMGVSNAFAAADMVLGGYQALIPFDEVVDEMYVVGKNMPHENLCTTLGGVAATATAKRLQTQYEETLKKELQSL